MERYQDRRLILMGRINEGSVSFKGDTAEFLIENNGKYLNVFFSSKYGFPDNFKEGIEALLEGKYDNQFKEWKK
jgi:cytochrome c-type biogenesis protein CcmE